MWVRVDDGWADHPKVRRAGLEAAGLWLGLACYAARFLTDGVVSLPVAVQIAGHHHRARRLLARLVEAGLLEPVENPGADAAYPPGYHPGYPVGSGVEASADGHGGRPTGTPTAYRIHDWSDYQPSSGEVKARRRADSQRKARQRERQKEPESRRDPLLYISALAEGFSTDTDEAVTALPSRMKDKSLGFGFEPQLRSAPPGSNADVSRTQDRQPNTGTPPSPERARGLLRRRGWGERAITELLSAPTTDPEALCRRLQEAAS